MRHRRATTKLGRKTEHRLALIANQVCSLIEHERIRTTLAKAKAVRPFAERAVTMGKKGTLHARRQAVAFLHSKTATKKLFEEIAPRCAARAGGYTRIVKLGPRLSDSAPMALLEWVDLPDGAGGPVAKAKAARERREQKREAAAAETEKRQGEQQETPGEAPGGPAAS